MEGYKSLSEFQSNPIIEVSSVFENTTIRHDLLQSYLRRLHRARSVQDLFKKIKISARKISALEAFDSCNIEIHPGKSIDTAVVRFLLQDKKPYGINLGVDSDPFQFKFIGYLRNTLHRPNISKLTASINPQTRNLNYELSHLEKLTLSPYLQYRLQAGKYSDYLDTNIEENKYGGSIAFSTISRRHTLEIGRNTRTNSVHAEHASIEAIKNCVLPTSKNYLMHTYQFRPRRSWNSEWFSAQFSLSNEVAVGENVLFHKVKAMCTVNLRLNKFVVLAGHAQAGCIPPWPSTQYCINDAFRYRNFKGFNYLGRRQPPHDGFIQDKINAPGDYLGNRTKLLGEVNLIWERFPILSTMSIYPFVYANAAYIPETNAHWQNIRASTGFGLKWQLAFGNLEFSYATKVWKQPGDMQAEFKFYFNENK